MRNRIPSNEVRRSSLASPLVPNSIAQYPLFLQTVRVSLRTGEKGGPNDKNPEVELHSCQHLFVESYGSFRRVPKIHSDAVGATLFVRMSTLFVRMSTSLSVNRHHLGVVNGRFSCHRPERRGEVWFSNSVMIEQPEKRNRPASGPRDRDQRRELILTGQR